MGIPKKLSATFLVLLLPGIVPLAAKASSDEEPDDQNGHAGGYVEYVEVQDSSLPSSNTIVTKLSVPLQLTPANVGIVGEPLIYEQSASVLSDALRNVSGLNVQNGSGVSEFFTIRGFDSISSGLIMTDGAAEPEVSYYQMYNVRGVEVFKGPAGFLYGKNPLSGAVNIVRKQPVPKDFTVFRGSYGSFNTSEGTVDWNISPGDDRVNFRLNGVRQESDHFRDDKESRHIAVNPSLTWHISEKSKLNVNLEHVEAEYTPDSGLPLLDNSVPDVRRENSYDDATDFSEQTLDRFQADFEMEIRDNLTFRNKTYYRSLDWQSDGSVQLGQNPVPAGPDPEFFRTDVVLDDRQEFMGNQAELIVRLGHGTVEHELLAGVEFARQEDEYTFNAGGTTTLYTLDNGSGLSFPSQEANAVGDVRSTITAPYLIDHVRFSEKFQVLIGARYDFIDFKGEAKSVFDPGSDAAPISRRDSELSPMAGAVYAPFPHLSVYANASRSHAPPSSRLAEVMNAESLEPERGTQYEFGVKKSFADDKVRTTLALYRLDREDIALSAGAFGFTQQAGDQRSRGVELEVAAEPLPGLRVFFSYAYNDSELIEFTPFVSDPLNPDPSNGEFRDYSGNTPIMAPEHVANLWVSKSFSNGFGISGGARFVDEQFIDENNAFAIENSVVLDAAAFYDMDAWRFKLNLKNLTDEEYEMRGIVGSSSVVPADPFTVYGSIEFRM